MTLPHRLPIQGRIHNRVSDDTVSRPTPRVRSSRRSSPDAAFPTGVIRRRRWERSYAKSVAASDVLVIFASVFTGQLVRFGPGYAPVQTTTISRLSYSVVSVLLAVAWLMVLSIFRSRAVGVIGRGVEEYRRVVSGTFWLFGAVAIVSLLLRIDLARGYLLIAFPLGLVALLVNRWLWRQAMVRRRRADHCLTAVLVVGPSSLVKAMVRCFDRHPESGFRVVGACVPGAARPPTGGICVGDREIAVFGDENAVFAALHSAGADTIVVTATAELGNRGVRELAWSLEPLGVDLMVAPGVIDVAGPRLQMRPVAQFPLIHVGPPQYRGAQRFNKRAFDLVFVIAGLVVVAPVFLAAALAVRLTSDGPVFYKGERIGLDGKAFPMFKFRSMVVDADKQLALLVNESDRGMLFKVRADPRVTGVGRFLRRYSIDELPQFLNVLRGEMSVVGPRPPLRCEVERYDGTVRRRLLVRPGITGMWQISGRSELSWEESVQLDLAYVENWSMVQDLVIILKTLRAVLRHEGAY
ncbi:sugar transferase [Rhodococcus tibetensis]|uniref:Sugar transferase n=1 Tax=Rhodococcus tibetensis TaxID=2965064 RepID=A0ABT1QF63_9NOCA|nr:sugar transferase [Rhodococcus sp. FXJ9.536]MCQ4120903.1 sugar transferase [Rhodococcus sp. FXJ9.536]